MSNRKTVSRPILWVLASLLAACGGAPYSPVAGTRWLEIDRGIVAEFDRDESLTFENELLDKEATWTYAPAPDQPGTYHFKDGDGRIILQADLSGMTPDADQFTASTGLGDTFRFVRDSGDARRRFDERLKLARHQAKKSSVADAPRDPGRYVDVVTTFGPEWATYYALSQDPSLADDDKRLAVLSDRWNATQDSFARQDMRASELSAINGKIASIGRLEYIALRFGYQDPFRAAAPSLQLKSGAEGGYDPTEKGFPLLGDLCSPSMSYGNTSGATVVVAENAGNRICSLPVAQESTARQLEALRVASQLQLRGTGLFKLGPAKGTRVALLPVGARLEVGNFGYDYANQPAPMHTVLTWGKPAKAAP